MRTKQITSNILFLIVKNMLMQDQTPRLHIRTSPALDTYLSYLYNIDMIYDIYIGGVLSCRRK